MDSLCAERNASKAYIQTDLMLHCSCRSGEEAQVDILSGAGALLGQNRQLASGLIETTRLKDANQQEPSKSVVQSVEFHPAGQLLLTAGLDKRLRLFQV